MQFLKQERWNASLHKLGVEIRSAANIIRDGCHTCSPLKKEAWRCNNFQPLTIGKALLDKTVKGQNKFFNHTGCHGEAHNKPSSQGRYQDTGSTVDLGQELIALNN